MQMRTMKSLLLCFIIPIALIATGCGQESDIDEDTVTTTPGEVTDPSPYRGAVVITDTFALLDVRESDEFEIRTGGDHTPVLENHTLTVTLSYGGGCETHDVTLFAGPTYLRPDAFPAELDVILAHDANGDECEAYLTATYAFDLSPIKTWYQQAYMDDAGTIILHFQDAPDDFPDLVYTFGPESQASTD